MSVWRFGTVKPTQDGFILEIRNNNTPRVWWNSVSTPACFDMIDSDTQKWCYLEDLCRREELHNLIYESEQEKQKIEKLESRLRNINYLSYMLENNVKDIIPLLEQTDWVQTLEEIKFLSSEQY